MKTDKKPNLKNYQKAWERVKQHYLFGGMTSSVHLFALESNNEIARNWEFTKDSFCGVRITNDEFCDIFLLKENKHSEDDWFFVFLSLMTILGLEVYKSLDGSMEKEFGAIAFASSYVKNNISSSLWLSKSWNKMDAMISQRGFKNEQSVFSYLEENKDRDAWRENFLLNNRPSIKIEKNENPHNAKNSFGQIFVDELLKKARMTISLKGNMNLSEQALKAKNSPAEKAKKWFVFNYPLLSSLASSFEIVYDARVAQSLEIDIAAVSFKDKTIFINPSANLNEMGMRFVIAHEILHVALNHAKRRAGRDHLIWNLACDFVINDWLIEMCIGNPPEGIFFDKELKGKSADEIYLMIASNNRLKKRMMTMRNRKAGDKGNSKSSKLCDIMDDDYFSEFEDACAKALLRGISMHHYSGRGDLPASFEEEVKMINQPAIPWQVELAEWIGRFFPLDESRRSYAKSSRRQSSTPDIARPSYIKPQYEEKTRTYGVILDTSASMDKILLGKCLGAIASYSEAQNVHEVRLVYCDAQPYDEGYVNVNDIMNRAKMKGRGGTVLQTAVNYLENSMDFPKDAPILILTDGYFESSLKINRHHAFLVPNRYIIPFHAESVFEFS